MHATQYSKMTYHIITHRYTYPLTYPFTGSEIFVVEAIVSTSEHFTTVKFEINIHDKTEALTGKMAQTTLFQKLTQFLAFKQK